MHKYKMLSLILTGILITAIIYSFGITLKEKPVKKQPSKINSITIWAWDEQFNIVACKEAKKIYEKINPDVNINIVNIAQEDIILKLNTSLYSGVYDELPDILLMEDYKVQNFLNLYPESFKDLTSIVDQNRFMEYKLNTLLKDGKIYGVPFDSGVTALFYRTDYLQAAGYYKEDLTNITWEEYIEIGKKVKQATGKYMFTLNPGDLTTVRAMLQSAGEWYVKKDGKTISLYDNEALRAALSLHKQMLNAGIIKPVSSWGAFLLNFQQGNVATVPSGCWAASSIMVSEDQYGKWAIAQIPRIGSIKKSVNVSNVGGSNWIVIAQKENADIAADFLAKTFASSDELINSLIKDINLVTTIKNPGTLKDYNMKSGFFGGQEIFKDFGDWTEKIPAVNYGRYTSSINPIISDTLAAIAAGGDLDEQLLIAQKRAEAITYQ